MNSLGFTELTPEGSFILLYLMPTLLPLIPCSILSMLTTESCHILPTHHGCLALSPSWLPCPLSIMAALPSNCHSCLALSPSWLPCPLSIMAALPSLHHDSLAHYPSWLPCPVIPMPLLLHLSCVLHHPSVLHGWFVQMLPG